MRGVGSDAGAGAPDHRVAPKTRPAAFDADVARHPIRRLERGLGPRLREDPSSATVPATPAAGSAHGGKAQHRPCNGLRNVAATVSRVESDRRPELTDAARAALMAARAKRISYDVRVLRAPDGRPVVILGEAHLKLAHASRLGRAVVAAFDLRGVEWFQRGDVAWGSLLMALVELPRRLLVRLSMGSVKESTIVDARDLTSGQTVSLEAGGRVPFALHVGSIYLAVYFSVLALTLLTPLLPRELRQALQVASTALLLHFALLPVAILLRRRAWSWLVHPLISIVVARDRIMADGAVRMLAQHPEAQSAVLVMGRAHGPGVEELLVSRFGFRREDL